MLCPRLKVTLTKCCGCLLTRGRFNLTLAAKSRYCITREDIVGKTNEISQISLTDMFIKDASSSF